MVKIKVRIELIIVGNSFFGNSVISFSASNLSITEFNLRKSGKNYKISLTDQNKKIVPLYKCLLPKNHVIGTSLDYRTKEDEVNGTNKRYRGDVNVSLMVFDSETFLSHSEQIEKLNAKLQKEIEVYGNKMKDTQKQFDERLKTAIRPYLEIIEDRNVQLRAMSSKQLITAIKFDENLISIIINSISEDIRKNTGLSEQQLEEEVQKMFSTKEISESEIEDIIKGGVGNGS